MGVPERHLRKTLEVSAIVMGHQFDFIAISFSEPFEQGNVFG